MVKASKEEDKFTFEADAKEIAQDALILKELGVENEVENLEEKVDREIRDE